MINLNLEKEIRNNFTRKEIFTHQKVGDMLQIDPLIQECQNSTDLVVTILMNELVTYPNLWGYRENPAMRQQIWNHFLAIKLLKQMEEKLDIQTGYHLEWEEEKLREKQILSSSLISYQDVLFSLIHSHFDNIRLHFIARTYSGNVCSTFLPYLNEKNPFPTMFYLEGPYLEKTEDYCEHLYHYFLFQGLGEGEEILFGTEQKAYEKKI